MTEVPRPRADGIDPEGVRRTMEEIKQKYGFDNDSSSGGIKDAVPHWSEHTESGHEAPAATTELTHEPFSVAGATVRIKDLEITGVRPEHLAAYFGGQVAPSEPHTATRVPREEYDEDGRPVYDVEYVDEGDPYELDYEEHDDGYGDYDDDIEEAVIVDEEVDEEVSQVLARRELQQDDATQQLPPDLQELLRQALDQQNRNNRPRARKFMGLVAATVCLGVLGTGAGVSKGYTDAAGRSPWNDQVAFGTQAAMNVPGVGPVVKNMFLSGVK